MAVPPIEVLNSRNINLAVRAAELGWVTKTAANEAVQYTLTMAGNGEFTDAFQVLVKNESLSLDSIKKIYRDENAPHKWWQIWKLPHGPKGVWGASVKDLLNALYGKNRWGRIPEHIDRVERELQRRIFEEPEKKFEIIKTMRKFKRPVDIQIFPDPIYFCLKRWQKMGLKLPDDLEELNIDKER